MNRQGFDVGAALEVRARVARLHERRNVVVAGDDSSVDRHHVELFGVPVIGDTATAGRHLVEWVGDPSPLDSPLVSTLRARGLLTDREIAVLERASLRRTARVDGLTSRTLTVERDAMTETIRWGAVTGSFIRAITFADARRIFDEPALAHEFCLVVNGVQTNRFYEPDTFWLAQINGLRALSGQPPVSADHARLRRSFGANEGLKKVDALARVGDWTPYHGR